MTTLVIGSDTVGSDGYRGEVLAVVIDPAARTVTHLVVEPHGRAGLARLVPLDLADLADFADARPGQVRLRCTEAEFMSLEAAEETLAEFVPGYPGPVQLLPPGWRDAGGPTADGGSGEVTMRRLFARPDSPRRFRTRVEELEVRAQPALLSVAVSFPALLGIEAQMSFFAVSARVGAGTSLPAQANEHAQIAFALHAPAETQWRIGVSGGANAITINGSTTGALSGDFERQSAGYGPATNRYDIQISGGASHIDFKTG